MLMPRAGSERERVRGGGRENKTETRVSVSLIDEKRYRKKGVSCGVGMGGWAKQKLESLIFLLFLEELRTKTKRYENN